MKTTRYDSNGIVLQAGETQLPNGRYRWRYDKDNNQHDIYSWRLRKNDPMPEGHRKELSLREKKEDYLKQINNGLKPWAASMTVDRLIRGYLDRKQGSVSEWTMMLYESMFKTHIEGTRFSRLAVGKVRPEDVERFYLELSPGVLKNLDNVVRPAFSLAVKKRIISTNPAAGAVGATKKTAGHGKPEQRHALTGSQLEEFLSWTKEKFPHHYKLFYFLAWTGCRIGEALALTWDDLDFQAEAIHVSKTLVRIKDDAGKWQLVIQDHPKTDAGNREIPMLKDVKAVLLSMKPQTIVTPIRREQAKPEDNLVFGLTVQGKRQTVPNVEGAVYTVVKSYNKKHDEEHQLPHISPHTFRHTFTCWLIENWAADVSLLDTLKYIQSILGHTDASTTLNIYAELRPDKLRAKHEELRRIAARS